MGKKADIGYNMPKKPDGTVDLNAAMQRKMQETQKISATINEQYKSLMSQDTPKAAATQAKYEVSDVGVHGMEPVSRMLAVGAAGALLTFASFAVLRRMRSDGTPLLVQQLPGTIE